MNYNPEDITLENDQRLRREKALRNSQAMNRPELLTAFILSVSVGFVVAAILVAYLSPALLEALDSPGAGTIITLLGLTATVLGWVIVRSANRSRNSK